MVEYLHDSYRVSERRACRVARLNRGTFRAECLDAHWFTSLTETRQIVETWRREYNETRPHRALGERTPTEFANEMAASRDFIGMQTAGNSP